MVSAFKLLFFFFFPFFSTCLFRSLNFLYHRKTKMPPTFQDQVKVVISTDGHADLTCTSIDYNKKHNDNHLSEGCGEHNDKEQSKKEKGASYAYPWLAPTAVAPGLKFVAETQPTCQNGSAPTLGVAFHNVLPHQQVLAWAADGTAFAGDDDAAEARGLQWSQFDAYTSTNTIVLKQPEPSAECREPPVLYGHLCAPTGYTKTYDAKYYEPHMHYRVYDPQTHLLGPVQTVNIYDCYDATDEEHDKECNCSSGH